MSTARILAIWLLLAVLMVLNGVMREIVLVPQVGASAAALSAIVGIGIILGATGLFFHRLAGAPTATLARTSVLLVVLTIAFEFVFGHWVDGKSWAELAGNYAIWNGRLWPVVLASLAVAPFLWGRWVEPGRRAPIVRAGTRERRAAA